MCAGPVLGVPCFSLQSLLIMQESSRTRSPGVRLTQEHERGWSQACLWGGVWEVGPRHRWGLSLATLPYGVHVLSVHLACCNGKSTRSGGEVPKIQMPCAPAPEYDTVGLDKGPRCCAPLFIPSLG